MNERLKKQIDFITEIDKLKNIYRQTYVLNEDRKENDSEHSWHIAVLAFILAEYSDEPVDVLKTVKMLLIHDIVEIDAGDTYYYDSEGYKSKREREEKASERIFGLLPDDQRDEMLSLWNEFEERKTPESKFANVLDHVQPLTLNYKKHGIAWQEHGIYRNQVLERNSYMKDGSETLWNYVNEIVNDAHKNGWLK
ncbi:MAG: HD domain-containing protein [Oscillospiraceae bacterium]|nr:HD domain-containing protein [Oscillospiraceae bacterium]